MALNRVSDEVIQASMPTAHADGTPQHILVLEDEPEMARLIARSMEGAGFYVAAVETVPRALDHIDRCGLPHLALVDIMLPGEDGFAFCRAVLSYSDLPLIMISAIENPDTIVRSIEHYAEDYITKPFHTRELVARVQRVLRRIGDFSYTLAPLTRVDEHLAVDFSHQRAVVGGRDVTLTPIETKILYILMRNAGRTVSTDFFLRRLWPTDEVFEDTLRVHIHRVRQKIEPDPAHASYIVTRRGTGYAFPSKL
jgi:DNA-binding response OmpR family regulator